MSIWSGATVLITGGTGSFANAFVRMLLNTEAPASVRLLSRSELRRSEMQQQFTDGRLRWLTGDVADYERMLEAMDGVNIVVHAAASKRVEGSEQETAEAIKTNVGGSVNVVRAAVERRVERVMGLSSDKACGPVLAYGAMKLLMEKMFSAPHGGSRTIFACCRYGNVAASAGSIIPKLLSERGRDVIELRDARSSRFWMTLGEAARWIKRRIELMEPASIYVPALPSVRLADLASAISPMSRIRWTGMGGMEKVHEAMIAWDESRYATSHADPSTLDFYRIGSQPTGGAEFEVRSDTNETWLSVEDIRQRLPQALRDAGYPEHSGLVMETA